jgi:ATP-binding cassette, subfamily B, bacterial
MKTPKMLTRYLRLLGAYLRPLWRRVVLLALMLFGAIALHLWKPQILRDFIDLAQGGAGSDELVPRAILFFGLAIAGPALHFTTSYVTQDVRWRATNRMRGDLAGHCLALDMPFHNAHTPGSIIERIDGDVDTLSNFFSQLTIQIIGNALLLTGILALLFREDGRIGAVYLVFVSAVGYVLVKSVSITAPLWKEERQVSSEIYGYLEERLAGTEDIRSSGAVPYVLQGLQKLRQRYFRTSYRAMLMGMLLNWGFTEGMLALGTVIALGLGGLFMLRGEMTIGTVYLIVHYNTMLQWPLNQLSRQLRDLQSATGSIERIQELFDTQPAVTEPGPETSRTLPPGPLSLAFEAVDFRYPDDDDTEGLVLDGVSWRLEPGDIVGVLGRTGSGKTTMTRMLSRLYDPIAGEVRIGGALLTSLPLAELRRRVGVVTQDVQTFQASVRDNLTLFDASIDDEQIRHVVDELGLTPWLDDLPEGLDTELGTGAAGLSAGEAQLLAFTRVFLRNPGLVILDEASSRLDPATERLMERAVGRLFAGRTGVIVAHRLGTVQRADKILIVEDGRVAEFGDRLALAADPGSRFSHLLQTGLEEVLV